MEAKTETRLPGDGCIYRIGAHKQQYRVAWGYCRRESRIRNLKPKSRRNGLNHLIPILQPEGRNTAWCFQYLSRFYQLEGYCSLPVVLLRLTPRFHWLDSGLPVQIPQERGREGDTARRRP